VPTTAESPRRKGREKKIRKAIADGGQGRTWVGFTIQSVAVRNSRAGPRRQPGKKGQPDLQEKNSLEVGEATRKVFRRSPHQKETRMAIRAPLTVRKSGKGEKTGRGRSSLHLNAKKELRGGVRDGSRNESDHACRGRAERHSTSRDEGSSGKGSQTPSRHRRASAISEKGKSTEKKAIDGPGPVPGAGHPPNA